MSAGNTIEATFCFVDIAGFTALTDTHGELAAADLVDDFSEMVRKSIEPVGHLQALMGDCAFLIFPSPVVAVHAMVKLYQAIADRENFPIIRAGMHHGTALVRGNQHFGTTVNLAARVTAQATGGRILCTRDVAEILTSAGIAGVEIQSHGPISLRNLPEPVELFELVLSSFVRQYAIDPVCKMQVDTRRAAGDLHFNNKRYWFCSLECVERFTRQPACYI